MNWSRNIILCTDSDNNLPESSRQILNKLGIKLITEKISKLSGANGLLDGIVFKNGEVVRRDALFFITSQKQRSPLAQQLGCRFSKDGFILTDKKQKTSVKGVFAAGDAIKDMKFVIVAAGEGTKAGIAINAELQSEELQSILKKISPQ